MALDNLTQMFEQHRLVRNKCVVKHYGQHAMVDTFLTTQDDVWTIQYRQQLYRLCSASIWRYETPYYTAHYLSASRLCIKHVFFTRVRWLYES
jgi:hypothetical protein